MTLKPIKMGGGGYSAFLQRIKTEPFNNCIAKFIIIDVDRLSKHTGEEDNLSSKGTNIDEFFSIIDW